MEAPYYAYGAAMERLGEPGQSRTAGFARIPRKRPWQPLAMSFFIPVDLASSGGRMAQKQAPGKLEMTTFIGRTWQKG